MSIKEATQTRTGQQATEKTGSTGVHVATHPVIQYKLAVMRDKKTSAMAFRQIVEEISQFLAYEATRDLKTKVIEIETPLERAQAESIADEVVLVAIMRAGNGMLNGFLKILPFSTVGHIGIYRDKFIKSTVEYYLRLPKALKGKKVLLLDPLLATGDTACAAIDRLKEHEAESIRYVSILASPQGIAKLKAIHPDVDIHTCNIERTLDERGYLLPGVGDAGDRLYDTV
jgi:uracil phosphoribosyltransferase